MNSLRIGYVSTLSKTKILMDEKSWRTWKSNQKIVMDEELDQNGVMNEEFVKNFVMNAKIDEKVVMDLSIFTIGGWNSVQPTNLKSLEASHDEREWMGIPSKDLFLGTQCMEQHLVRTDLNV